MSNENGRPSWYHSNYRGHWNWDKNKYMIDKKEPLRCPYCGNQMDFATPTFYESKSSDWYWFCPNCRLELSNKSDFSEEDLNRARRKYRKSLEDKMKEAKEKYEETKKLYNAFGTNYTPEEKRKRLIETIEEHTPKESIE